MTGVILMVNVTTKMAYIRILWVRDSWVFEGFLHLFSGELRPGCWRFIWWYMINSWYVLHKQNLFWDQSWFNHQQVIRANRVTTRCSTEGPCCETGVPAISLNFGGLKLIRNSDLSGIQIWAGGPQHVQHFWKAGARTYWHHSVHVGTGGKIVVPERCFTSVSLFDPWFIILTRMGINKTWGQMMFFLKNKNGFLESHQELSHQ